MIEREDEYNEILCIEDGELVYIENNVSKKQAEWLEEMNIQAKKNIIPIFTGEQFKKIGSGEEIQIEEAGGETYQFNMDSYYVLQNDINLNCSKENQWIPIGTSLNSFKGILDGKNHHISGIYIESEEKHKALINVNNGTIQNIILDKGYISGNQYIAGIVTTNNSNGKIINCVNQVEIYASYFAGGIVASNSGLVENCENRVYLELESNSGSICGTNQASGIVRGGINKSEILLKDWALGGIVGRNYGIIEKSYNLGDILASTSYARYSKGGVAGINYGTVKMCYNLAMVKGNVHNWDIGGITGTNEENGVIEFSYNVGEIVGVNKIGGIVGNNIGNVRYSYTINTSEMTGVNTGNLDNCLKLSEMQMKNKENVVLADEGIITFLELLNKEGTYFIEDTKNINKGYPVLE